MTGNVIVRDHYHDWVPVGHEKAQEDIYPPESSRKPRPDDIYVRVLIPHTVFHWYIVKACRNCDAVWWMEYEPSAAREAVPA